MTLSIAKLEDRAALSVTGEDASGFLQGLVTANIDKVSPDSGQSGALLTPQGKILFDLFITLSSDGYLLETGAASLAALAIRLGFYKLRAKVNIEPRPDLHVVAAWSNEASAPFASFSRDSRWPALGYRAAVTQEELDAVLAADKIILAPADAYHAHRLKLGVPEAVRDYVLGDIFPQDANFDLLNGVDFAKGCYVGQEVVSRMHHKSTARKRILPFRVDGSAPAFNGPVLAGDINLGMFGSSAAGYGLALTRIDRLEEALAAGAPITAGNATLTPLQPDWADFKIVGTAA